MLAAVCPGSVSPASLVAEGVGLAAVVDQSVAVLVRRDAHVDLAGAGDAAGLRAGDGAGVVAAAAVVAGSSIFQYPTRPLESTDVFLAPSTAPPRL